MSRNIGRIECWIGPMYAGKSTTMWHYHDRYDYPFVKPICTEGLMNGEVTHDGKEASKVYYIDDFKDIEPELTSDIIKCQGICFDECQFYGETFIPYILSLARVGIHVVAASLSARWDRTPWTITSELVAVADEVHHIRGRCHYCGAAAMFSKRLTDSKAEKELDANGYRATCRSCYEC